MQFRNPTSRLAVLALSTLLATAPLAAPVLASDSGTTKPIESETAKPVTDAIKDAADSAGKALDSAGNAIGKAAVDSVDGAKDAGKWTADKAEQGYDATKKAVQDVTKD